MGKVKETLEMFNIEPNNDVRLQDDAEVEAALQILDYYKNCAGGDAKSAIERSIDFARECIKNRNKPHWVDATKKLPQPRALEGRRRVRCIVILVFCMHSPFSTETEQVKQQFVYTAEFDTDQKIWHITEENLSLNALLRPEDLPMDCEYVSHWMYIPEVA